MSEAEDFYDAEVAPVLLELSKKCRARGMSFVATVEFEPGATGETVSLRENADGKILMTLMAVQAHGNADLLIMAMSRYAEKHGHSSAALSILGVPTVPTTPTKQ